MSQLSEYACMSSKRDDSQTKSLCSGRFVTGPDSLYFYLTLVFIYAPMVPFIVLICTYFDGSNRMSAGVYVIIAYLLLVATLALMLAAFSDPGIVPRGRPLSEENPFAIEQKVPQVRKHNVKGVELETKWCDTCDIYRPIRTSHCGICNNCVENFDHHCPWVGNCIGKRNYRYYLLFIVSASVICLYVIALCVAHIILNTNASDKHSRSDRVKDGFAASYYFALLLPIYAVAGLGFVGGLSGFHCYLVGHGMSTNEFIKKTFKNKPNPHSHGFFANYVYAFCPPFHPSFFNTRRHDPITTAPTSVSSVTAI